MSTASATTGHRIVVGADGSESSGAALSWAVRQAGLTGATGEAVIGWHYPVVAGGMPFAPVAMLEGTDYGKYAAGTPQDTITAAVDPASTVKISSAVRQGNAARLLSERALRQGEERSDDSDGSGRDDRHGHCGHEAGSSWSATG